MSKTAVWKGLFFDSHAFSHLFGKIPDEIIRSLNLADGRGSRDEDVYQLSGLCFDLLNNGYTGEYQDLLFACHKNWPETDWGKIAAIYFMAVEMRHVGAEKEAVQVAVRNLIGSFFKKPGRDISKDVPEPRGQRVVI